MSKKLSSLLEGFEYDIRSAGAYARCEIPGMTIPAVVSDDRRLSEGCLFICCRITNYNGAVSMVKAAEAGAAVIVTEPGLYEEAATSSEKVTSLLSGDKAPVIIFTEDTRYAMAFIWAAWYDHPADRMTVIGVTGTKGKTTVTHMIYEILKASGRKAGLVGTLEYIIGDERRFSPLTTPEADILQEMLHEMADAGTEFAVIETASQALMTHRTQGFTFDIGIFTNISPDHIAPDEHSSFDNYLCSKSLLMRQCRTGIVNGDDPHAPSILKDHSCSVRTFGLSPENDLYATDLVPVMTDGAPGMTFNTCGTVSMHVELPMPGEYSVMNALAAIQAAAELGIPAEPVKEALSHISVRARMSIVRPDNDRGRDFPTVIVDFAHNAVSLRTLLETLSTYYSGKIICVFGCANQVRMRRSPMGEAAGELADFTVITSFTSEQAQPDDVLADILEGMRRTSGRHAVIKDRREAIKYALSIAGPDDVVILTAKGHYKDNNADEIRHSLPDDFDLLREIFDSM